MKSLICAISAMREAGTALRITGVSTQFSRKRFKFIITPLCQYFPRVWTCTLNGTLYPVVKWYFTHAQAISGIFGEPYSMLLEGSHNGISLLINLFCVLLSAAPYIIFLKYSEKGKHISIWKKLHLFFYKQSIL